MATTISASRWQIPEIPVPVGVSRAVRYPVRTVQDHGAFVVVYVTTEAFRVVMVTKIRTGSVVDSAIKLAANQVLGQPVGAAIATTLSACYPGYRRVKRGWASIFG